MSSTACRQCGSTRGASGGRCRECGGLVQATRVARRERRAGVLQSWSGDPLGWLEAVPALTIVPLVVIGVLPWPMLIAAFILSVRPFWRLVVRLAAVWDN